MQASIVAFYGTKPAGFADWIRAVQDRLRAACGDAFRPYGLEQIHATLIGLERADAVRPVNRFWLQARQQIRLMDIPGYVDHLQRSADLPLTVRFGGFSDRPYPFDSRGQRPYRRAFSIQGTKAVVIGWPLVSGEEGATYPPSLYRLRRAAEPFSILHAYHGGPDDRDNDAYMRLGLVNPTIPPDLRRDVEASLRTYLSTRPLHVHLTPSDLSLVLYTDETLPPATTRVVPLSEAAAVVADLPALTAHRSS